MTPEPDILTDKLPGWGTVILVVLLHIAVIAAALAVAIEIKPEPRGESVNFERHR